MSGSGSAPPASTSGIRPMQTDFKSSRNQDPVHGDITGPEAATGMWHKAATSTKQFVPPDTSRSRSDPRITPRQ